MSPVIIAVLFAAAVASLAPFCAIRINVITERRCDSGCGRTVELFTGVRDASRHVYCSTACADVYAIRPAPIDLPSMPLAAGPAQ